MSYPAEWSSSSSANLSKRFGKAGEAEDRLLVELGKKFRIVAQLGEGGTARVWLAMARGPSGFNKLVVLKTIRGEHFDNESVVAMFLEEARLAARLNHPNIVQTNQVFEQARHPVIVMEYLDGLPFSAILERQREGRALALAMLLRIVSDGLAGLHAAHELTDYDGTALSVVHRDVSPHNMFVTFAGQVKVLDFGIAQFNTSSDATQSGVLKGKLRYMAPEQIDSDRPVDRRADVFSMGVVLWEVATARRMWSSLAEPTIMRRILDGNLPGARELEPSVDQELDTIIKKALAPNADDRFSTAQEFQSALDGYLSTLGGNLHNRDIGRALSKMFEDVREERRATIERQLERSDTLHDIQLTQAPLPELTSFSNVPPPPQQSGVRFRIGPRALVALSLLAMLLFALAAFWPDRSEIEVASETGAVPEGTTTSGAPLREEDLRSSRSNTVALRITAFPRNAHFVLDGTPLESNPYVARVSADPDTGHVLTVHADGYQNERRTLTFDRDMDLVLTLQRSNDSGEGHETNEKLSKVIAHRPKQRPRPVAAPRPRPAPKDAPDCSQAFYYDDRGIKKYRPECL